MIRRFKREDLEAVMQLWIYTNMTAHHFIKESYWKENFEAVRKMLPSAEVYVFEKEAEIVGFIGLMNGYIAGIFVKESMQSQGIGKILLQKAKELYPQLQLNVYEKNRGATRFYLREGFQVVKSKIDENTGEPEFLMRWEKSPK